MSRQQRYSFIEGAALIFCQFVYLGSEIAQHLVLGNAAEGSIFWIKTDVAQIVEHREERDLSKLGDACDEDKLFVFVVSF